MKYIAVLCVLLCAYAAADLMSSEELKEQVTAVSYEEGDHLRAYVANWYPSDYPRLLQVLGLAVQKTDTGAEVDAVAFLLNTWNQTSLIFGYYHAEATVNAIANSADVSAAGFAFALRNYNVFEYVDTNGVDGFQEGIDTVSGYYDLSTCAWKAISVTNTTLQDQDGDDFKVWIVTAETLDEVFMMRFTVAGRPVSVAGVKITPDSVKVDVQIKWFNNPLHEAAVWTTGASVEGEVPQAYVAMGSIMAASAGTASYHANGGVSSTTGSASSATNPTLQLATSDYYTGFFTWEPRADVTVSGAAATVGVHATVTNPFGNYSAAYTQGWTAQVIVFSFHNVSRPEVVAWDPEVGTNIDYDAMESPAVLLKPVSLALLLAVVLALFRL